MKFDMNEALEKLAVAFNTTVEQLLPILTRQAMVVGITYLVGMLVAWTLFAIVFYKTKKWVEDEECDTYRDWEDAVAGIVVMGILGVTALFITIGFSVNGVTALFNPEYWAIKEVLSQIK